MKIKKKESLNLLKKKKEKKKWKIPKKSQNKFNKIYWKLKSKQNNINKRKNKFKSRAKFIIIKINNQIAKFKVSHNRWIKLILKMHLKMKKKWI